MSDMKEANPGWLSCKAEGKSLGKEWSVETDAAKEAGSRGEEFPRCTMISEQQGGLPTRHPWGVEQKGGEDAEK